MDVVQDRIILVAYSLRFAIVIFEKERLNAEDAWIQFLVVVLVKLYQIGLFLKLIKINSGRESAGRWLESWKVRYVGR